jgi:ATP-dependent helicase HrpA
VTGAGQDRLANVTRYLRGIERRLEKLPTEPTRDLQRTADVAWLRGEYKTALAAQPPGTSSPALQEVRWMIEELRVSFFAQTLGTAYPVSLKRVIRALDEAAT